MTGRQGIEARDLHAGYATAEIVKSVSCTFAEGSFTGIIGPNGSGKTTLLRAFSRVIPSSGILELNGRAVSDYTPAELGMALGFVPQDEGRPFSYTVLQVVLMARYARTSRFAALKEDDYAQCHAALEKTGIAPLAGRSIRTLSGGEWQRVLIARALAQETNVLLLDEPTSHLDLSHQSEVLALMRRLANSGSIVIGVFHDLNLAAQYCDRLIMIRDGRMVADGTPSQVLTPERIREVYGAEVVTACHPATGRTFLMPVAHAGKSKWKDSGLQVLVISGGGSGADLLHFLAARGVRLASGILATTDTDYLACQALKIPCIAVDPFSRIPDNAMEDFLAALETADRIVLPVHPVGDGNLPVVRALRSIDPSRITIHLPEGRDFPSFDFCGGQAAAVLEGLIAAGAQFTGKYDRILAFLQQDAAGDREKGE